MNINIKQGDAWKLVKELPKNFFHTIITSPPYFALRDYNTGVWEGGDPNCSHKRLTKISKNTSTGHKKMHEQGSVVGDAIYKKVCHKCGAVRKDDQFGLEETVEEYVDKLVMLFRDLKKVLRTDGTVWLNLGDSYAGAGGNGWKQAIASKNASQSGKDINESFRTKFNRKDSLASKNLIGVPWRVAFALQKDGWYLRQDIIWNKPNPMPESVKDRCTKSHEYVFLLTKKPHYYFDHKAIQEDAIGERWGKNTPINLNNSKDKDNTFKGLSRERKMLYETKNKRSVWTVATKPYRESHFAVFPYNLIKPMILAGCPEKVCKKCGEPYLNKEILVSQDINLKEKTTNYGKYGDESNEKVNRQGFHKNRGTNLIEFRPNLPDQKTFVKFIRARTNAKTLSEATNLSLTKIEHWFRSDKNGFSFPSKEDWNLCKDFINDWSDVFCDMDRRLSEVEMKTDEIKSSAKTKTVLTKQCDCDTDETQVGRVLDPFGGAGTTALVSSDLGRDCTLLELNKEYVKLIEKRIMNRGGLFDTIKHG
tara:strand:+ start:213 stop:1814 length:1602 start_codon:yes stop_codon:yes gene_type:complete